MTEILLLLGMIPPAYLIVTIYLYTIETSESLLEKQQRSGELVGLAKYALYWPYYKAQNAVRHCIHPDL